MNTATTAAVQTVLDSILVLATVALAIYTARMARATKIVAERTAALAEETHGLAKQTVEANALADQHHQELMMPIVIIEDAHVESSGSHIALDGNLRNIGPGVALNVRVWIGQLGLPIEVSPLQPYESRPLSTFVLSTGKLPDGNGIGITIFYENLFKSEAKTEHHGRCASRDPFNTVITPPKVSQRVITP